MSIMTVDIAPRQLGDPVYVSQGDIGRIINVHMYDGDDPYIPPAGVTPYIQGLKPSGLGFNVQGTITDNVCTFSTTDEMTDEVGDMVAEVRLIKTGMDIGTANFRYSVEERPRPDGTTDGTIEVVTDVIAEALEAALEDIDTARAAAVAQLATAGGVVARTASQMTEPDQVYIYVGSETGYTAGNWYYYNGSAWTSGGTYGGAVTSTTFNQHGVPADDFAVGQALVTKADASDVEILADAVGDIVDSETVVTWSTCDKDDSRFTQIPGYILASGAISGATSDKHKTWYFTATEDIGIYVTRASSGGQIRLGVYNTSTPVTGNIDQYGSSGQDGGLPSQASPFHVTAGQCVAVSIYNQTVYDWVLHCATTSTTGTLKSTLSLTAQMGAEVDEKIAESAPDISNQIADISALSTDALLYLDKIPTYYTTPETNPASFDDAYPYLERRIKTIPDVSKSFVFITDTHWAGNAKHSTQLINYIRKRTGIRKVLFGGDVLGNAADKYLFVKNGGSYLLESRQAFGTDYIPCVGDHDSNTVSVTKDDTHFVPYQQAHEMFMGDVKRIYHCYDPAEKLAELTTDTDLTAECLAFFHTVYYVDDVERNIRFIVLNCGNAGDYGAMYDVFGDTGTPLMRLQFDFLAETLMDTPAGMNVCVLSHKGAFSSVASYIFQRILSAFKAKKNWTNPESSSQNETIDTWWPNRTNYNFTEAPDIGILFTLQGHVHYDNLFWSGYDSEGTYSRGNAYNGETLDQTKGQIPHIFTSCDAYMNRDALAPAMELGTITEQCFDIVSVSDGHIHLTRFGAGSDRDVYVTVE